MTSTDRKTDRY